MIVSLILALLVAWFVIKPLTLAEPGFDGASLQNRSLTDQKERCQQVLEDLELDCRTEKIKPDDYARMKSKLLTEIDQIQEKINGRV